MGHRHATNAAAAVEARTNRVASAGGTRSVRRMAIAPPERNGAVAKANRDRPAGPNRGTR